MIAGQFFKVMVDMEFVDIVLVGILVLSLYTDIRYMKILNVVTVPAIFSGIVYHTMTNGFLGFGIGLGGCFVGLALFFIPFIMGGIGAGDVKLMGAVGALKGPVFVLYAGLASAVAGGVIAVIVLIFRGRLIQVFKNIVWGLAVNKTFFFSNGNFVGGNFPYGIAIVAGTFFTLVTRWNIWLY